ncbi:MAG: hypothetical protein OXU45_01280 [Candidatus Melainabacteria bacterium]|nr:hypothetical protein [Candidatus Melainabacteria bacterium]
MKLDYLKLQTIYTQFRSEMNSGINDGRIEALFNEEQEIEDVTLKTLNSIFAETIDFLDRMFGLGTMAWMNDGGDFARQAMFHTEGDKDLYPVIASRNTSHALRALAQAKIFLNSNDFSGLSETDQKTFDYLDLCIRSLADRLSDPTRIQATNQSDWAFQCDNIHRLFNTDHSINDKYQVEVLSPEGRAIQLTEILGDARSEQIKEICSRTLLEGLALNSQRHGLALPNKMRVQVSVPMKANLVTDVTVNEFDSDIMNILAYSSHDKGVRRSHSETESVARFRIRDFWSFLQGFSMNLGVGLAGSETSASHEFLGTGMVISMPEIKMDAIASHHPQLNQKLSNLENTKPEDFILSCYGLGNCIGSLIDQTAKALKPVLATAEVHSLITDALAQAQVDQEEVDYVKLELSFDKL